MDDETREPTLREKTNKILSTMPGNVAPEVTMMVGFVKLLLEEMDRSELSTLKDTVAVQRVVTDRLASDNKRLRERVEDLEDRFDDIEEQTENIDQHGRNINFLLRGIPEILENEQFGADGKRKFENTTKKFVDAINSKFEPQRQLKMSDIARSHRLQQETPTNYCPLRPGNEENWGVSKQEKTKEEWVHFGRKSYFI